MNINNLPVVNFANSEIKITRLISGGNPLCGNSHYSENMDKDMKEYFTEDRVVSYFHELQKSGINAIQARADYHRILYWLELFRREGGNLNWIAQSASEMSDVFQNIKITADGGAVGIYHHGTKTDNLWLDNKINEVNDYLKCIRDTGVQVGLGTHIPQVIEYAEEKNWDIDFYMCSFYNINKEKRESALVSNFSANSNEVFSSEDPKEMCRVIRQTKKMCLAFKILGAARNCQTQDKVRNSFKLAFSNIKQNDAVVVGMFPKYLDQINLNIKYTIECCN